MSQAAYGWRIALSSHMDAQLLTQTTLSGNQGGEDTFGHDYQFTKDLREIVAHKLPKVDVRVLVYPRFETRGDLGQCVSRFRDW